MNDHWENPETISLADENLRQLEEAFVLKRIAGADIIDIGCGACESTGRYALRASTVTAIENAVSMFNKASDNLELPRNIALTHANLLDMAYESQFDYAITQRVLINLRSWNDQREALQLIHRALRPGGMYLAVECFFEGYESLNAMRRENDLPSLPFHHWHNYYLHKDLFEAAAQELFVIEERDSFDLYYFLTRVFTPMFAPIDGVGTQIRGKADHAISDKKARILHEKYRGLWKHESMFGPIQCYALRKRQ